MLRKASSVLAILLAMVVTPLPATANESPSATRAGNDVGLDTAAPQGCVLPGADGVPQGDGRKKWWGDEGYPTDWERFVRPVGRVRAVMLFVDFPNARAEDNAAPYKNVRAYYDFLAPAVDWFHRSSYGRLDLRITPVPKWYRMPLPDSEYGITRDMPLQTQTAYVRQVVELADADVDFSTYDLVYIVPSRNANNIALSPAYVDGAGDQIPVDGTWVTHGVTFGRDMWSWGPKILVHETGHLFGLPDLYLGSGDPHAAVRGWDLMGNIAGRQPDLFAWHKRKLDWLRAGQIDCVTGYGTTQHHIRAVERPGGTKAVVIRTGETTAYVIESRRRLGNDPNACSTGVLVYAINSRLRSEEGPIRVQDATPGSALRPDCRDLDIATLRLHGTSKLALPEGVTIEVVRQSPQFDTVTVTKEH